MRSRCRRARRLGWRRGKRAGLARGPDGDSCRGWDGGRLGPGRRDGIPEPICPGSVVRRRRIGWPPRVLPWCDLGERDGIATVSTRLVVEVDDEGARTSGSADPRPGESAPGAQMSPTQMSSNGSRICEAPGPGIAAGCGVHGRVAESVAGRALRWRTVWGSMTRQGGHG